MLACSVWFMLAYNACTWITSRRSDVGTWFFEWELSIPFVPAMIVPYWSLDLLFVAGFFVCRSRDEVAVLGKRLALATLAASVGFLLFPLRLGFPRPPVEGFYGMLFDLLRSFDAPFNLCPSLHIALRTLLADTYARHTRGALRVAVHLWFSLIGFSTLLTWQHHLIDVAGGFVLATLCFYAVRERPSTGVVPNPRIALWYGLALVACLGAARATGGPVGLLLLWPALCFGLLVAGYLRLGPWVYGKTGPEIPLAPRLVMAPCRLGQELSRRWYAKECRPWDPVAPGIWIGRQLDDAEAAAAVAQGVTAVLDLTAEFQAPGPFAALPRLDLPVLDLTRPSRAELEAGLAFLAEHAPRGTVYVHCKIGYSRSAAMVGAWLIRSGAVRDAEAAVARLREVRPTIVVRPEAWDALREIAASGR